MITVIDHLNSNWKMWHKQWLLFDVIGEQWIGVHEMCVTDLSPADPSKDNDISYNNDFIVRKMATFAV